MKCISVENTQVFELKLIDSSSLNGPHTGIMPIEKSKRDKYDKVSGIKKGQL